MNFDRVFDVNGVNLQDVIVGSNRKGDVQFSIVVIRVVPYSLRTTPIVRKRRFKCVQMKL